MNKHAALTIGDVMTDSPATIPMDSTLSEAQQKMAALQVNHLPVTDNGVVESVISDRDIKRFTLPAHKADRDEELLVSDIMPSRAFAADVQDPLEKILRQMLDRHMSAVVVLRDGELAGIFTESDACRVLAEYLSEQSL